METLIRAVGKTPPPGLPAISITSVQLNPNRCGPGALFVPVQASCPSSLEAQAIAAAIRNGAVAAFTNLPSLPFRSPVPVMRAGSTADVLVALAMQARSEYRGRIVAITGSVGKTTTKELTHHVLSHAGIAHKMPGNYNTLEGILLATINRPLTSRFSVFEVASTRPGHVPHKTRLIQPHVGVVTNIGVSHLQNFSSAGDLFREKISVFDHLEGERIGVVHRSIRDADDAGDRLIRSKGLSRLLTVGDGRENDVHLLETAFDGIASTGTMSVLGRPYRFRLPLPARHFVDSAMFAIAAASALELDVGELISSLATATPVARRFQRYRVVMAGGAIELIDDAHNAAPASVAAMLDTLGRRVAGRRVLVLGDMLELGDDSARLHDEIAPLIAGAGINLLVTVGSLAQRAAVGSADAVHFTDATAAAAAVPSLVRPLDVVAVKGSNGVGLNKVVATIRALGASEPAATWRIEDEVADAAWA